LAEEELSFTEDDAMVLYEKDDPDWFLAEKNGIFGLVPSNYVEESTSDATVTMTTTSPAEPVEEEQHEEPEKTSSNHHNNDEALSWSVHEYDVIKKKKTKAKGNLLVGNGMLCYGSETDKATPVRQFNTSQVSHVVCDGKHVHIDLTGNQTLDFYTASKSEAKSIMTKIDSSKLTTASASSTSLAAPSLASDQQSDISASFHSPAASFQSLPPQQQQLPEHPRAHSPLPPAPVEPEPVPQPQTPLCEAKWAIALYPFTPESSEETSLAQHEQVLVTDYVGSNDWWVIEHKDGKSGIVPASYVQFQDEFEAQTAKEEEEEELKKKKEQQEEIVRRQREEKQREEQQRLQEEQKRQEEGKKRKQEQDEVLKKQMEERERQRQQEEKEKARQIEVERRRKMQEEAKQKELDAKKMSNVSHCFVGKDVLFYEHTYFSLLI
jgi:hypothetical protein